MEAEHSLEQVLRWERRQVPWERVAVLVLLTVGAGSVHVSQPWSLAGPRPNFRAIAMLNGAVGSGLGNPSHSDPNAISGCIIMLFVNEYAVDMYQRVFYSRCIAGTHAMGTA